MQAVRAHNASFAWSTRFKSAGGTDIIPSLFEEKGRFAVWSRSGAVLFLLRGWCAYPVLRGFGCLGASRCIKRAFRGKNKRRKSQEIKFPVAFLTVHIIYRAGCNLSASSRDTVQRRKSKGRSPVTSPPNPSPYLASVFSAAPSPG